MNKKFYSLVTAVALTASSVSAQQLPNYGFEEWTTGKSENGITYLTKDQISEQQRPGIEPKQWHGSNINQIMDVTGLVDENTTGGVNGTKACKIINKNLLGNNIPGFISLGNPWVYADTGKATQMGTWGDGGVTGGIALTTRPDALSLEMNGNSQSCASVIAYMWKGEFVSQVRSAIKNNGSVFKPDYAESATLPMSNVDRAIMGRAEADQKGTLIASTDNFIDYAIGDDYKNLFFEFNYNSAEAPEMINVIISASNHWVRSSINKDNSINVDNVKLIYYSRLSALKVGGVAVADFDANVFNYNMEGSTLPAAADIEATLMGKGAKSTVAIDPEAATVTINVTNDGNDVDDLAAHSYVLQYDKAPTKVGEQQYPGYLNITVAGEPCPEQAATITITEYSDGSYSFLLPDLNVQLGDDVLPVGDIKLENVHKSTENGETIYTGYGKITVLGSIDADVNLRGTVNAEGKTSFAINVDASGMPVDVTFTTESQTPVVANYPGYLNINAFGSPFPEQTATITISEYANGTCTFLLPDLTVAGELKLGDIKLDNVAMTKEGNKTTYSGEVKGMIVGEGENTIPTETITLTGTVVDNKADFLIKVSLGEGMDVDVTFTTESQAAAQPVVTDYPGYLNINAFGSPFPEQTATITISEYADGTCTFLLPDLTVAGELKLGDIKLDNVAMTKEGNKTTYSGEVKGMIVGEGENTIPTETITLTGTVVDNKADFLIKVSLGEGMDVDVTFTTDKKSGIAGVNAETGIMIMGGNGNIAVSGFEGMAQIYTVDGRLVKTVSVNGEASIDVARGLYIVKAANVTGKVIVK